MWNFGFKLKNLRSGYITLWFFRTVLVVNLVTSDQTLNISICTENMNNYISSLKMAATFSYFENYMFSCIIVENTPICQCCLHAMPNMVGEAGNIFTLFLIYRKGVNFPRMVLFTQFKVGFLVFDNFDIDVKRLCSLGPYYIFLILVESTY